MPRTCTMNIVKLRKLHGPSSSLWMSPGAQRLKDGTNKKNSTAPTTAHPQKDASHDSNNHEKASGQSAALQPTRVARTEM